MRVLRFLHARRMLLCLGSLVCLALASGCSDQNPVDAVGPEAAQARGKAQQEARERQFGKAGTQVTKPKTQTPAPPPEK
jgi:hypothetical protein